MKRSILLNRKIATLFVAGLLTMSFACSKSSDPNPTPPVVPPVIPPATNDVDFWLTKGDQSVLLQKQSTVLSFGTASNTSPFIDVDSTQKFQTIDGFGYTLTGGSAYLLNQLAPGTRTTLLRELYSNDNNAIGVSYIRISIGASDLNASVFTYDDVPVGQTDVNLDNFSLAPDMTDLIPILKEILVINPSIKILATPWTAPVWMKDNENSVNGSLKPEYYDVYAKYFVKYIQAMKTEGITIDAITPQNEPLNPFNNPSMVMTAEQQRDFIKNSLGPAFQTASLTTKIIAYDHNCDVPNYPLTILNDAAARPFVNGSAFHLYAGNINVLSQVHDAYPDKAVYFTEQYTSSNGNFGGDLKWHLKNVLIGSTRNWSRVALEWNLANDASFGPHTTGGCTECKGAITLSGGVAVRNVAYYIIAHASKFVPAGSTRIYSSVSGDIQTVAFLTPAGKKVLVVENDGDGIATFNIRYNSTKWTTTSLNAGSVATYTW